MEKEKVIEEFLKALGRSSKGKFFIVCGKCGAKAEMDDDEYNHDIEHSVVGKYSDYTGHLWDDVTIKCKICGNAVSFIK